KKARGEPRPEGPPAMQPGMAPLPPPGEAEAPPSDQGGKQKKAKGEPQPPGAPAMQPKMAAHPPPSIEAESPASKTDGKQKKAKKVGRPVPREPNLFRTGPARRHNSWRTTRSDKGSVSAAFCRCTRRLARAAPRQI